jgi:AraC-like DNA-binding protein
MAESYSATGQNEESKNYLLKAINIAQKIGNLQFMAMNYSMLARNSLNEEDFTGAIKYGLKADSLLKKNPYQVLQINVDSMMFAAYSKLSRYKEALAWHLDFVKIKDKVIGEKQEALLNKMMIEFGIREKNLIISNQNAKIQSNKIQLQLLTLLLLITLLFIILMFRHIVKIRRHRASLYQKEKYLDGQIAEVAQYKHFITKSGTVDQYPDESEDKILLEENVENSTPRYPLYLQLRDLLETRKLYLDPELNQQTLINLLGTNKKYLYQAIAGYGEENFRSLINRYRVDESKRIMELNLRIDSMQDMNSVYAAAGFNSAASFYRIFKNHTGLTPAEYTSEALRELKKAGKSPS